MLNDSEMDDDVLPFEFIEKAAVIQECKCFDAVTVKIDKCMESMVKVLYLLATGHTFTQGEATGVFMSATKLFQCDNQKLRRMLFVFLKSLSGTADQTFIASSSLVRDITNGTDSQKCNAIRTLRLVTDPSMIGPMERYLRQGVVDKNSNVNSAAIVSGIHLCHTQPEMVKRWGTEVSEALKMKGNKVQYHALALLHKLRKSDRMSVMKLVGQAQTGPLRSPLALCLLIKHCTELMQEDFASSLELYKWVSNMTHHHSDMVVFEAAKSLCSLKNITAKEITPAVLVLQLYLASHRPVLRFAAVRLLSRVATFHPAAIQTCCVDLENLINDSNRSIATMAITTLLKAATEFTMERLLKQIGLFMSEISDEFKIVVIDALKIVCAKFPQKYQIVLDFLSSALHDEGGAELKRGVVETIITLAKNNKDAKESALTTLCEFIEDCEYNGLVTRVLYVLGEEGPTTSNPHKYIRCMYNRIALEAAVVRAAAVSTLAKFGASCPSLRDRIVVLLERSTSDVDDEVRDRAVLYRKVLMSGDDYIIRSMILDVAEAARRERASIAPSVHIPGSAADVVSREDSAALAKIASQSQAAAAAADHRGGGDGSDGNSGGNASAVQSLEVSQMCDAMRRIQQLRAFGEPLRSTELTMLTEGDSEYVVGVVKHIYGDKIVFQYRIQNTMEDNQLRKVMPQMEFEEMEVEPKFAIPVNAIKPGCTEHAYVVVEKAEDDLPAGTAQVTLNFALAEADDDEDPGETEGYPLDEFAINISDYISPRQIDQSKWEQMAEQERVDTYELKTMRNLTQAAHEVIDFFGMHVVGGKPSKITSKAHTCQLSGIVCLPEQVPVMIAARVFITTESTVALELTIRGGNEELREFLSTALVS